MDKKEKATRKLESLKEEYYQKVQEAKTEREQLEAALRKTSPNWNQSKKEMHDQPGYPPKPTGRTAPLQLYSMRGPIDMTPESAADSIALDCHTHFVSGSQLDASMLNKLAIDAYNKVLADFNRQKTSKGANMEQRILEGVGKIVKEFEQKRMNPFMPKHI